MLGATRLEGVVGPARSETRALSLSWSLNLRSLLQFLSRDNEHHLGKTASKTLWRTVQAGDAAHGLEGPQAEALPSEPASWTPSEAVATRQGVCDVVRG